MNPAFPVLLADLEANPSFSICETMASPTCFYRGNRPTLSSQTPSNSQRAQDRGGQITQAAVQPEAASRGTLGIGIQGVLRSRGGVRQAMKGGSNESVTSAPKRTGLLVENMGDTILRMNELVRLDIRFSIDDFGTGYSNLGNFSRCRYVNKNRPDPRSRREVILRIIAQLILSMASHMACGLLPKALKPMNKWPY